MKPFSRSPIFRVLCVLLLFSALCFAEEGGLQAEGRDLASASWAGRLRLAKERLKQEPADVEIWAELLSDRDFGVRKFALDNMPKAAFEQLKEKILQEALGSPYVPLRKAACGAFARNDGSFLLERCRRLLEINPTPRVLDALGWLKGDSASELIAQVIAGSKNPLTVEYAFRVLTRNPDRVGFRVLSEIAGDSGRSPSQRVEAIGSLGRFHFKENLDFLIALLDDPDLEINAAVWESLQELTGKSFIPERGEWEKWAERADGDIPWQDKDTLPQVQEPDVTDEQILKAAEKGCDWLIRHQSEDGRFDSLDYSAKEGYSAGRGTNDTDVCMTSLAIIAFISAGISGDDPASKRRAEACRKAVEWLVTVPKTPGDYRGVNPVTYVHEQGAATWALAEYFAAGHHEYAEKLTEAFDMCMKYRDGDRVWGYPGMPGNTSNSCVTLWYACGFAAARQAGYDAPKSGWDAIGEWFDYATIEYSGYIFNASIKEPSEAMTGVGLLAKGFLQYDMNDRLQRRSAALLLKRPIGRISYYDLYCYSLGLSWMDDPEALKYRRRIAEWLVKEQISSEDPAVDGSWDPKGDIWETSRLYTAGMAIPCLDTSKERKNRGLAVLRPALE
ncbi:MAG: hypothetical protein Kow00107_02770 [Planctomycetota bacterium]